MAKNGRSVKPNMEDLVAAPYNPRRISDAAATGLGHSLEEFGDISGIVWNATTRRLVCGHQRVTQLRERGAKLVRGALQLPSGERFAVRVVEWSEAMERAANVAANNPHIAGEFTEDLEALLAEIQSDDSERYDRLLLAELESSQVPPVVSAESQLGALEYRVIITCNGEADQAALITELERKGYTCQALIS